MSSNEIKSTSEMLSELTELVKTLVPDKSEKTINPDTQLLLDAIKENNNETKLSNDIFIKTVISQNDRIEQLAKAVTSKECKPTELVEVTAIEDEKFSKRRITYFGIGSIVSAILSVLTFNFTLPAFPFAMLMVVYFLSRFLQVLDDEYMYYGKSIERVGNDAKAIGLSNIALAIIMVGAIGAGILYISNPLGSENEKPQQVIERTESNAGYSNGNTGNEQPAATRSQGTQLPISASEGTAQSEQ